MIDKEKIIRKFSREFLSTLEENPKLKEILGELLSGGYEIIISNSFFGDFISITLKKSTKGKFLFTSEDQEFLKSIKIKSDE